MVCTDNNERPPVRCVFLCLRNNKIWDHMSECSSFWATHNQKSTYSAIQTTQKGIWIRVNASNQAQQRINASIIIITQRNIEQEIIHINIVLCDVTYYYVPSWWLNMWIYSGCNICVDSGQWQRYLGRIVAHCKLWVNLWFWSCNIFCIGLRCWWLFIHKMNSAFHTDISAKIQISSMKSAASFLRGCAYY